ncbi:MAG: SDR family oxidoreductase [Gracilibacteraceae bacterium]|nr:SDR family oxidoreductase [Gracilibacteraceae bacterium]
MKKVEETRNVFDLMRLDGKVAVVTGSASGIGQAMALALAEAGADIVGTWNNKPVEETRRAVEGTGRRFVDVKLNLKDLKNLPSLIEATLKAFGKIDILVNNAGVTDYVPIEERTYESYSAIMDVNLNAVYILTRAACLQMREMGVRGRVINVGSICGVYAGGFELAPYVISKHGVFGVTQHFAYLFAKDGITVNEVNPGFFDTPIHHGTATDVNAASAVIPMGRAAEPEELKGIAVFLASESASYITGQQILVDGGLLLA